MMTGAVNSALDATLSITVHGTAGQSVQVDAVIDTGYSGFLTLPRSTIAALGLAWLCRQQSQMADGSIRILDVFMATVIWDGQPCLVEVEDLGLHSLIGMNLMHGFDLRIQVKVGGSVSLAALP